MMNDTELFELCKEVYEKTGWGKDEEFDNYVLELGFKPEQYAQWQIPELWQSEMGWSDEAQWPLYTSDYLLEKLPHSITVQGTKYEWLDLEKSDDAYRASYGVSGYYEPEFYWDWVDADTPVKALLRLTLALKEAGEI